MFELPSLPVQKKLYSSLFGQIKYFRRGYKRLPLPSLCCAANARSVLGKSYLWIPVTQRDGDPELSPELPSSSWASGVKRNNGVFIIPLFLPKNFRYSIISAQKCSLFQYSCSNIFVIPLFLLKNFHYSFIPPKKAHSIPLFQEQNSRYSYSIIRLQPPIEPYSFQ